MDRIDWITDRRQEVMPFVRGSYYLVMPFKTITTIEAVMDAAFHALEEADRMCLETEALIDKQMLAEEAEDNTPNGPPIFDAEFRRIVALRTSQDPLSDVEFRRVVPLRTSQERLSDRCEWRAARLGQVAIMEAAVQTAFVGLEESDRICLEVECLIDKEMDMLSNRTPVI